MTAPDSRSGADVPCRTPMSRWHGASPGGPALAAPGAAEEPYRYPLLVGVLVLDDGGEPVEVVAPFAGPAAIPAWAELHGVARYRILPARLPGVAAPR
jgi:hypothetical protein